MEENENTPKQAEEALTDTVKKEEYDRLKNEFDAFRQKTEAEERARQRREEMREALKKAGARQEEMIELLLFSPEAADPDKNADAAAQSLRRRYGACFQAPKLKGMDPLSPPAGEREPDPDTLTDEEYYSRRVR